MSVNKTPLVSVVMATFNESPEIIRTAIESILMQTYNNIELLVIDDSSNEDTIATINSFNSNECIKIIRSDERMGFIKSLNKGLSIAKGEYIARMDGDDISLPNRIGDEVEYLESNSEVMVVGGQINIIDEHGNKTASRNYPTGGIKLWLFSCLRNPLAHPTIMMRRSIVDNGFLYDESLKMSEDLDLWLRIMNDGYKIANLPNVVLNYRVLDNFVDKRTSDVQRTVMAEVRTKNFSRKHLVHSLLSWTTGWIFTHIPKESLEHLYRRENKQ